MLTIHVILAFVLLINGKVRDILNIPKSKLDYAKVILKETIQPGQLGYVYSKKTNTYRITFEFDNFKTVTFQVSEEVYNSVHDGSRGVLVYIGSRFRGFHIDKKIPDIVKKRK